MSTIDRSGAQAEQTPPHPVYLDARAEFAARFLAGDGLEIGPLHQPLAIPAYARASYVDRMKADELRREYPELADWDLTEVDIVDDGELLTTIAAESQDFIVANHFLEHTENPIGTIENHLGKLKPGGVLFYAVPDKRYTFDFRRPPTPIEHMVADYELGPERSRHEHYVEWCRLVIDEESGSVGNAEQAASEEWVARRARELEDAKYSIHMHVWTQAEFLKLILALRERFGDAFDIEAAARVGIEFIVVLRKAGSLPPPPPATATVTAGATPLPTAVAKWKFRARRALGKVRREIRQRRARP
ncbi:MAG: Methyltransferase type 11 [Solirubrobacterales bacterium]|nr:Methyltransferase type 11 [Solirubrobacterales bacterium]